MNQENRACEKYKDKSAGSKEGRSNIQRRRKIAVKALHLIRSAVHSTTALGIIREDTHSDPFKILISTILSARTRDSVTEKVSARLFTKYSDVNSFANADPSKLALDIRPVSFYQQKAKSIVETSKLLLERYHGSVPNNYEELMELPGVGRKTAGCVLVYGFGKPAIPVDTHVHRISNRIGLVDTGTPEETEAELTKIFDKRFWIDINELFVSFGKTVCLPVNPRCSTCPVKVVCRYYKQNLKGKKN